MRKNIMVRLLKSDFLIVGGKHWRLSKEPDIFSKQYNIEIGDTNIGELSDRIIRKLRNRLDEKCMSLECFYFFVINDNIVKDVFCYHKFTPSVFLMLLYLDGRKIIMGIL